MNRRELMRNFFQKTIAISGYLSFFNTMAFSSPGLRRTKNWVWITPDIEATDDEWKRRFEQLKNAQIDAILPEIYNGTFAFYGSSRLPVKAEYLERLIPIAKSFQLEIHAWMWTMPCMVKDIQKKHPDWYMVNAQGQSCVSKPAYVDYYKFLCPSKEEVQDFIQGTVKELSDYDVDGIHLDYVRYPDVILAKGLWSKYNIVQDKEYPQYDYCYCETCRKKFKSQEGIDPVTIKEPSMHQAWLQFRYDQVTNLVNNKLIPIAHKNAKVISAAVFPNWKNVRQQWSEWKLDAVMPMLYNRFYLANAEWIKQFTKAGIQSLKYDAKYYSGLMVDEPDLFKDYVHKAFEGGAQGISLFSLNALSDEHLKILTHVLKKY
ncbi:MAG: family 10 glycosylhydrolase [Calditrichae bacterium]|nr:family 10 glycosylhydrolase [Calditrichia bacterium]